MILFLPRRVARLFCNEAPVTSSH